MLQKCSFFLFADANGRFFEVDVREKMGRVHTIKGKGI